jgi:pilus assembly protein CpaD
MPMSQKARIAASLIALLAVAACAGHGGQAQRQSASVVEQAELSRTVLDAWRPSVAMVESRLQVGMPGTGNLTAVEHQRLQAFAREFIELGEGNVAISVPSGSANQAAAAAIATETQRALFAYGVDYSRMVAGGYQAGGEYAPVTISFARYEARAQECVPWSQLDPRPGMSNGAHARLGCASANNLAAMIANPGDLRGERTPDGGDAARISTGMEALRAGELAKANGSVKGGE